MGRPAVLKRELTANEVATIRDYAERYVGYRKDYMSASAEAAARPRRSAARKGGSVSATR